MTEANTCREFVTPRLVEAGWGVAESVIGEQHIFTNCRIIVAGGKVRRGTNQSGILGALLQDPGRHDQARWQVHRQVARNRTLTAPSLDRMTVPVPPLVVQDRIVRHLELLAEKAQEIEVHLDAVEQDAAGLIRSYIFGPDVERPAKRRMSELVSQRQPDVAVDGTAPYRFAGVYSFGRGVFPSAVKMGSEFAYERLSTVRADDFIYPKLMAWEGALGVVPPACDGMVVSPEFPVFTVKAEAVLPEVLDIYFRTPDIWPALAQISGGTNARRRRLQPATFLSYEMPVPSMAKQLELRAIYRRTQLLKTKHAAIRQANAALLPATLERIFQTEPLHDQQADAAKLQERGRAGLRLHSFRPAGEPQQQRQEHRAASHGDLAVLCRRVPPVQAHRHHRHPGRAAQFHCAAGARVHPALEGPHRPQLSR